MTDDAGSRVAGVWHERRIVDIIKRTPSVTSYFFDVGAGFRHVAGQHMVVRLTAPDGYSAMRSYSIASAPSTDGLIELAVERLEGGEVSAFFHDVAAVGDMIELRGPLGGHFIWSPDDPGPSLLIGGGSGVVPLMAMLRQRCTQTSGPRMALLLSARTRTDAPFFDELVEMDAKCRDFTFTATFTRQPPERSRDLGRRVDKEMIAGVLESLGQLPMRTYICGSHRFVDAASDSVLAAGIAPGTVRTERYGGV